MKEHIQTSEMASTVDNNLTDDIIKRRLLIDGDGMGDERKLNTLMKSYLSFVDGDDTEDNNVISMKRLVSQAKQLDYVARRSQVSIKVNEEAKEVYVDLQDQVQCEVRETKRQIIDSKALLEEATKHRKYSMEYDALAKLIESKPDRKLTEIKRMGLQLELDTLRKRKQKLDDQLNERKRIISQLGHGMELVKESLKVNDDRFNKKTSKSSRNGRNGETQMDVDSTSQSEPPSPVEQVVPEPVITNGNGTVVVAPAPSPAAPPAPAVVVENKNGIGPPPTVVNCTFEKAKSEKYEDLSESEGDDHS